jgi:hypothetical protein
MNNFFIIFNIIGLLVLPGCNPSQSHEKPYTEVKIEARAADFKVPKKMLDQIETDLVGAAAVQSIYLFAPIAVVLSADSNAVIKNNPTRITFPNGGGKIDLAEYVSGQGSFYMSFPKEQFETLPTLEKLYFISDSPKKKIEDEEFGLGCGKFIDIKNQFESLKKNNYLKLNTTDLRYLYVVSGYYIFVFKNNNQISLTHLHITDSRYPDRFCSSLYKQ